jgi:LPPG:FO 2-phospho-L-lactate transferase
VAECYADFLDGIVIDHADADLAETIRAQGLHVTVTDTIMRGLPEKRALAEAALSNAQQIMAA